MTMYNRVFEQWTFSSTCRWIDIKMRNYRIIVAAMARPGSYHLVRAGSQEEEGFSHTHTHALIKIPMIIDLAFVAAAHN